MLAAIYTLYTVPLTFVSAKFSGDNLENLFPGLGEYDDQRGHGLAEHLSGLIVAGVWSTFFACCPILFKVSLLPWSHAFKMSINMDPHVQQQ